MLAFYELLVNEKNKINKIQTQLLFSEHYQLKVIPGVKQILSVQRYHIKS